MEEQTEITREQLDQAAANLAQTVDSGAKWFYWIAALSLINYISTMTKAGFGFAIGLNIADFGGAPGLISVILIAIFGFFAVKRQQWAFIIGLILYALDGAIAIPAFMNNGFNFWLLVNAGFHLYALYGIYQGMRANSMLMKLERLMFDAHREAQLVAMTPSMPPPPYNPIEGQVSAALKNEPPLPKE